MIKRLTENVDIDATEARSMERFNKIPPDDEAALWADVERDAQAIFFLHYFFMGSSCN